MHDYYYRGYEDDEIIIQAIHNEKTPLSIRVSEDGSNSCITMVPFEEIDRMIAGLQAAKQKIIANRKGG